MKKANCRCWAMTLPFLLSLLCAASVLADQIVVGFSAVVFYIDDFCLCVPPTIDVGDTVVGYYTYESPAADANPDPKIGRYVYLTPPNKLVVYLEQYKFETDASAVNIDFTVSDSLDIGSGPRDRYRFTSWNNTTTFFGYPTTRLWVYFDDETLQALSDDSLPTLPPDLLTWGDSHALGMLGNVWGIYATIISTQSGPPTGIGTDAPEISFVQNLPNPFSGSTTVSWLAESGPVTLRVYDVKGRLVRTLIDRAPPSKSRTTVVWNGKDDQGRLVTSGIYFLSMATPSVATTRKMVLIR